MRKIMFLTCCVIILITCFFYVLSKIDTDQHSSKPKQMTLGQQLPDEKKVEVSLSDKELQSRAPQSRSSAIPAKEKHLMVMKCKRIIDERRAQGIPVSDSKQKGMIDEAAVLSRATEFTSKTSDTSRPPDIALVGDYYIVSYYKNANPFRADDGAYDCRIAIDAWSGEVVSIEGLTRGVYRFPMSNKTGAGDVNESSDALVQRKRVYDALQALTLRVMHGKQLNSDLEDAMVSPHVAVQSASQEVKTRSYDNSKEPLVILVEDIYIVTFWKNSKLINSKDGYVLYDSRVGIDAFTGEFIGMEISR